MSLDKNNTHHDTAASPVAQQQQQPSTSTTFSFLPFNQILRQISPFQHHNQNEHQLTDNNNSPTLHHTHHKNNNHTPTHNHSPPPPLSPYELEPINEQNLQDLKQVISDSLPVQYSNERIFQQMLKLGKRLSCVVYCTRTRKAIGAMGCRVEVPDHEKHKLSPKHYPKIAVDDDGEDKDDDDDERVIHVQIYLMTIAVLAPYRNMGIGSLMLRYLKSGVDRVQEASNVQRRIQVDHIYLHVQEGNTGAIQLYRRHGFDELCFIERYYQKVMPCGAHVLRISFPKPKRELIVKIPQHKKSEDGGGGEDEQNRSSRGNGDDGDASDSTVSSSSSTDSGGCVTMN